MDVPEGLEPALPVEQKSLDTTDVRLERGALHLVDIATSTMANIAPAMSFFFSSALLASTAGIGSPLVIVLAAIAIALLGNTLAEFSRALPSTGSFITFIGKTFGPIMAVSTTIVISVGYIVAISSVIDISGGWTQIILQKYVGINVPWQILTLLFVAIAFLLMVRGVHISTRFAGYFFLLEMIVLVLVSLVVLITRASHLSLAPFNPANIGGMTGLGAAFPIAVYLFVGWENSASLAEETNEPRRNVPKAIYSSIFLMAMSYVLFMYATVVAYNYNTGALAQPLVPFIDAAQKISGILAFLAYLAGFTSIMSAMIAGSNSQSRLIFHAAREGILPSSFAKLSRRQTPWASFLVFFGVSLAIVYLFGWSVAPVVFFGDIATLGTILIALVYLVSNLALPVYYWRELRAQFSWFRHLILPLIGVCTIGFPLWALVEPGQSVPFNYFPWIALGIVVLAVIYAIILNLRKPGLGDRVGSILADRE